MAGFISETITRDVVSLFMVVAWERRRNAMSPVPPAMSRKVWVWGDEVDWVVEEVVELGVGWRPGFRERTKRSFQRRWM